MEKIIKENLLVGNLNGAIDCALKSGRIGEALLLAHSHSEQCFVDTMNEFFSSSKDNFVKNVL